MDTNGDPRSEYLARVASLYYDHNKTQQEIADEIGVTRSAVSRLLTEARAKGIVEIIVHYPWRTSAALEQELVSVFNLKAARVLLRENKPYTEMLKGLGVLAAQYFTSILEEDSIVGIAWGTGLHELVLALRPMFRPDVEVVQLIGGTGTERSSVVGPLLAPLLANCLGGTCWYLHAPLMMESEAGRVAILQERSIRETLSRAEQADIALVGMGSTNAELYNPLKLGYVSEEELERIREAGAVGVLSGHHYDIHGNRLDIDINRRIVGISLDKLTQIDTVIGVAGDARKSEAIYGALVGEFIDVLITDDEAASRVIGMQKEGVTS